MKFFLFAFLVWNGSGAITRVHSFAAAKKRSAKPSAGGGGGFGTKEVVLNHDPDTSETTKKLLQFLKANNAKGLNRIEIGYDKTSGIRGLFALEKIKKNSMICQVPSDVALALSDPAKGGEEAPTVAHCGSNFLSMYWDNEQQRQNWAPYLDTLPVQGSSQFDGTPDYFDEEELELLEFPRLIRQVKQRRDDIMTVANDKSMKFDDVQFASWLVSSRAFSISIASDDSQDDPKYDERGQVITKAGDQKALRVMVPFIDIANHSSDQPNAKLTLIDPEKDDAWFALEATRPISPGKEVVISYGTGIESSSELLLNYGFVPQSNKIDTFMLKKGGDECITSLDGWTTTLEEDLAMLDMAKGDPTLSKILNFRIKLKQAYE